MSQSHLTCAVIVPFLDEERHIETFLGSIDRQVRRPDALFLVDDGSTDRSGSLAREFAATRHWAHVWSRPPQRERPRDRLVGAPELVAFLWARDRLTRPYDVVAKMDADLRLGREHIERVMAVFARDPRAGIAGTYLHVTEPGGELRRERHPPHHVRGPTRFYRRQCLDAISPLPVSLGWDGGDEVRARARGWRTISIDLPDEPTIHLRPTGAQDGRLRAYRRWGACAYAVGTPPLAIAAGAAIRARQAPPVLGSLAYVWGWAQALRRRRPRLPDDIRSAKRREQSLRLRLRRVTAAARR